MTDLNKKRKKVVLGVSGGMDSTTLLAHYLNEGYEVHACIFTYGSKHNPYENAAARKIIIGYNHFFESHGEDFRIFPYEFDLTRVFSPFSSNLLRSGGDIPEGHYNDENMRKTVVPGRNLIMASIMAGLAESIGAETVSLGVHSGDHHIYPDCRPEFISYLSTTVELSTDGKVAVDAPFSGIDKAGILKIGYSLGALTPPYELTRTCYKDQPMACGKCGSCRERLEAFEIIGKKDPVQYQRDEPNLDV